MKNRMKIKTVILCFFAFVFNRGMVAQTNKTSINVVLKGTYNIKSNKISLRWNISDYSKLEYLMTTGVVIDKLILDAKEKVTKDWQRITPNPIKALSKQELETGAKNKDTGLAVLHKCLYEQKNYPGSNFLESVQNQDMAAQNQYFIISLYAAMKNSTALAAGLGYDDNFAVDSNKSYVYRISMANGDKSIASAFVYVYGKTLNDKYAINSLNAIGNDGSITLNWNAQDMNYNGYWIEKSTDKINFTRINKVLYVPTIDTNSFYHFYNDSVGNYKTYYYRVAALNSFGEYKYSNISEGVFAKDLTPPNQPFLKAEIKGENIELKWTPSESNDIKGYYILKSKKSESTDSLLSTEMFKAKTTEYKFKQPINFKRSYYRILAIDTAGNYSLSNSAYVFVSDQAPPKEPWGLGGTIDTNGVVNLNWAIDTTDEIIGYKVFFANQEDHVFTAISNIIDRDNYVDTAQLKTLTEYIFYKIVAVDQNYNHSKFSKALKLKRPDKIAPPQPVILDYWVKNNFIFLNWTPVQVEDLQFYTIYRRKSGENNWNALKTTKDVHYVDSNLIENIEYEYAISSVDKSNLSSPFSFPISVKTGRILKKENTNIKIIEKTEGDKKTSYLTWSKSRYEVKRTLIYIEKDGNLVNTTSVNGNILEWKITNNKSNLAIRFLYVDGTESELIFLE